MERDVFTGWANRRRTLRLKKSPHYNTAVKDLRRQEDTFATIEEPKDTRASKKLFSLDESVTHARTEMRLERLPYLKKKGILEGPTTSFRYSGPEQRCQLCGSRLKMAFPTPTLIIVERAETGGGGACNGSSKNEAE